MNKAKIESSLLRYLMDQGESDLYFDHVARAYRSISRQRHREGREMKDDNSPRPGSNIEDNAKRVEGISQRRQRSRDLPDDIKIHRYELPEVKVADKKNALEEYNNKIHNCTKCRLSKNRNHFVFGEGNPNADIVFIGEAPGQNEDETGKPFVGRGGQLLTKIIEAMNLKREEVFIGNVIKCRPPNNRDPRPDEVAECIDYLLYQIAVIEPKILIFLGRIAAQTLLDTKMPMRELRKTMHKFAGIPAVVTYHPAALLRNPAYKRPTWEDMKRVMAFLEEKK